MKGHIKNAVPPSGCSIHIRGIDRKQLRQILEEILRVDWNGKIELRVMCREIRNPEPEVKK